MNSNSIYHSISNAGRGIAAALLLAAGTTACTDHDVANLGTDGITGLRPQVTILADGNGETIGRAESSGIAGNSDVSYWFSLTLEANKGIPEGDDADHYADVLGKVQTLTVAKATNDTEATIDGSIYVPKTGTEYTLALGGKEDEGSTNAPCHTIPALVGKYTGNSIGNVSLAYAAGLKPVSGAATNGTGTDYDTGLANGYTLRVTPGDDGTISVPLQFATAGILLQMSTAEGWTVSTVTPTYAEPTATGDNALHFLSLLDPEAESNGTDLDGIDKVSGANATTGKQYWMNGALVPGTYAGGSPIAVITVKDGSGTERQVPLNLATGLTATAGKLYSYHVLVDAVKATVSGSVSISGFDKQTEVNLGGGDSEGKGYTGDATTGFTVYTADGLIAVSDIINAGEYAANITIANNIDMNDKSDGKTFKGICVSTDDSNVIHYTGTFDGNGMIISNLTIDRSSNGYQVGFIGQVGSGNGNSFTAGYVKNLTLVNPTIIGNTQSTGGIVGSLAKGSVTNCHVIGGNITGSGYYVGGIVGVTRGDIGGSTAAEGCSVSDSKITNNATSSSRYSGGIVGYIFNGIVTGNTVTGTTIIGDTGCDKGVIKGTGDTAEGNNPSVNRPATYPDAYGNTVTTTSN